MFAPPRSSPTIRRTDTKLNIWQEMVIRAARHVTYF